MFSVRRLQRCVALVQTRVPLVSAVAREYKAGTHDAAIHTSDHATVPYNCHRPARRRRTGRRNVDVNEPSSCHPASRTRVGGEFVNEDTPPGSYLREQYYRLTWFLAGHGHDGARSHPRGSRGPRRGRDSRGKVCFAPVIPTTSRLRPRGYGHVLPRSQ